MPIAVNMNGGAGSGSGSGGASPISPRMTKAAFFRARSPPLVSPTYERPTANLDDLSTKFALSTSIESSSYSASGHDSDAHAPGRLSPSPTPGFSRYQPDQQSLNVPQNPYYSPQATAGHTPPVDRLNHPLPPGPGPSSVRRQPTVIQQSPPPTSPRGLLAGLQGAMSAPDSHSDSAHSPGRDDSEETYETGVTSLKESTIMGIAEGSDEMLLTLLAGQAAVDCEALPIGGWEEVESWKKELSILSNRLESLQARHQREIKILTAARTLQKLNNSNKRMSRQTTESLEQSEKRVEAAEKEVLVLRDREASLRRRLMEHWAGVMAWEVRRLEGVSSEAQARYQRQERKMSSFKDREADLVRQSEEKAARVAELEEMVVEMGRRERAIEEEARELDQIRIQLEKEKEGWIAERRAYEKERQAWIAEKRSWEGQRASFEGEQRRWHEERASLVSEKQRLLENGTMSSRDRAAMDQIRASLGGILGRKTGFVGETEVVQALQEVKNLVERREREVSNLRDEMREVNMGLEEEVRRVGEDRDAWKGRVEMGEQGKKDELATLEKRLRNQQDQINDLTLRNESLSISLNAAQTAVTNMSTDATSSKALQSRVDSLNGELESIASQFSSLWTLLPSPQRRERAELVDPRTGASNASLASPSRPIDFAALQTLYEPHTEQPGGIDEMLARIRAMVDDGKLLVERVVRSGQERELHKGNAAKAKKLVEDSRHSLETYQRQVAVLEDRLAKSGSSESHFLDELNSLQSALDTAQSAKRSLEAQVASAKETTERLTEANGTLSAKALDLAQVAEDEKRALATKLGGEVEDLKRKLQGCENDADEERAKSQAQRIQLLDELNSLQAEVGDLRKQLRARV